MLPGGQRHRSFSAANHRAADVRLLLIKAARQRIGLADHTKFDRQSFTFVGLARDLDILVTDAGVDQAYLEQVLKEEASLLSQ